LIAAMKATRAMAATATLQISRGRGHAVVHAHHGH
jgi:hypothetical protein